jgi:hypothetical protein
MTGEWEYNLQEIKRKSEVKSEVGEVHGIVEAFLNFSFYFQPLFV